MSLGICLFYCCIRRLWSPSIMVYNNNNNISARTIILTILHLSTSINLHLYIYLYLQIYNTNRFLYHKIGKVFEGWAQEVDNIKKLREMVKAFYALCVKRLRLTPQAVMAFFAPPGEYTVTMSEEDSMKIRRLILSKLFSGWKSEVRELRGMRFKATQILARTMRRSKGPMWVKEGVLVCYHIWRRYSAVRHAYRREEPDPVFKNPHLPQWSKLLSSITLSRIHRRRAKEKGEKLTLTRALRTWVIIKSMDKSQLVTPGTLV